jgi:hypothetical protein
MTANATTCLATSKMAATKLPNHGGYVAAAATTTLQQRHIAATATVAAAIVEAAAAAGAQDASRLEPLVCFFFLFYLLY